MTIKIHRENKRKLKGDDERTFDEIVNSLIDEVEEQMPNYEVDNTISTSIKLDKSTIERLSQFKLTYTESYENVIVRLMIAKSLNTDDNQ